MQIADEPGLESGDHHHHNLEGCGRKGFVACAFVVVVVVVVTSSRLL